LARYIVIALKLLRLYRWVSFFERLGPFPQLPSIPVEYPDPYHVPISLYQARSNFSLSLGCLTLRSARISQTAVIVEKQQTRVQPPYKLPSKSNCQPSLISVIHSELTSQLSDCKSPKSISRSTDLQLHLRMDTFP
jgi:hypothetical protein